METDTQRIRVEKEFRDFIKSVHGENAWKEFAGSELEGTCINFITQSYYKKHDELESQLKEVSKLNDSFPNGLGDYEWKIIENFNSKNFRITELESRLKEKDVIISEYHAKMLSDKESYFEVVEAHDDLEKKLQEANIINLSKSDQMDELEVKNKNLIKDANQFIIQIADLLGIDADGIGYDGLQLSIEDFQEAINKLK